MDRADFAQRLGGERSDRSDAVVIEEREPAAWRRAFLAAAGGQAPVFLSNPDWGSREREQFGALVRQSADEWNPEQGWLMIPTGGSSGRIKMARHDQSTLQAAVSGYQAFFQQSVVSAVGVLPLHHVGGLMGWLRSALSGGEFVDGNWREIKTGGGPYPAGDGRTISLVPTQLKTLLEHDSGADWLRTFARVLIGGAGLEAALARRARVARVNVVPSYGSTETAAMVAAADQETEASALVPLPHVAIGLDGAGQVEVRGESICRGYWPDGSESAPVWRSGDLGRIREDGRIIIDGRADDLIVTGGEKVNPREVEGVIQTAVGDHRVAVLGVPDSTWGQRVVVVHHPDVGLNLRQLQEAGTSKMAAFKWPKQAFICDPWPVNAVGKLDRSKLRAAAESAEAR